MNQKLDDALVKDFPGLYRNRHADMRTTCMCWGFAVGDGWELLLRVLSEELVGATSKHVWGGEAKAADHGFECGFEVVVDQVKEKYGTLRYYYHAELKPNVPREAVDEDYAKEIAGRIEGAVAMAERMSVVTCEICGNLGTRRDDGWLSVRCDSCLAKETLPRSLWRRLRDKWERFRCKD